MGKHRGRAVLPTWQAACTWHQQPWLGLARRRTLRSLASTGFTYHIAVQNGAALHRRRPGVTIAKSVMKL